jgi:hypothetical protein
MSATTSPLALFWRTSPYLSAAHLYSTYAHTDPPHIPATTSIPLHSNPSHSTPLVALCSAQDTLWDMIKSWCLAIQATSGGCSCPGGACPSACVDHLEQHWGAALAQAMGSHPATQPLQAKGELQGQRNMFTELDADPDADCRLLLASGGQVLTGAGDAGQRVGCRGRGQRKDLLGLVAV